MRGGSGGSSAQPPSSGRLRELVERRAQLPVAVLGGALLRSVVLGLLLGLGGELAKALAAFAALTAFAAFACRHVLVLGLADILAVAVLGAIVAVAVEVVAGHPAGLATCLPAGLAAGSLAASSAFARLALALARMQGGELGADLPGHLVLQGPLVGGSAVSAGKLADVHRLVAGRGCHGLGLDNAAGVLHLALHPAELVGVGRHLRPADQRVEHAGGEQLLQGGAAHPLRHGHARSLDLFAQALPCREGFPEPGDAGAARGVLEAPGVGVLQLGRRPLPLRVEPAPELDAVALTGPGARQQDVGHHVLDALEQHVADLVDVGDAELAGGACQAGRQALLGLGLRPNQ